jgi:hypothetical protein
MRILICSISAAFLLLSATIVTARQAPEQMTFATPQEAATAVLQAAKAKDVDKLKAIFGANAAKVLSSGDPIQDKRDLEVFVAALDQSWRWVQRGANRRELIVGNEAWPFPIPLVKKGTAWRFDTAAGESEVLARRVGRNELRAIEICQRYVRVQQEYAGEGHDGKPAGLYAQKIRSEPGRQDGLYWSTKPGKKPSPVGDLAAEAAAEGYDREKEPTAPFHGYFFRILTAQGTAARGGARSYIVNGEMSKGFALVAYPASHKNSGVMTFIVNQDGAVFEKDLGRETTKLAIELKEFNPDKTWRRVRSPGASR